MYFHKTTITLLEISYQTNPALTLSFFLSLTHNHTHTHTQKDRQLMIEARETTF